MSKFRKKPSVIEAVQIADMHDQKQQSAMLEVLEGVRWRMRNDGGIEIPTANGEVVARWGDWVCRQVVAGKIDVWPCAADIFAATYEPADAPDVSYTGEALNEKIVPYLAQQRAETSMGHMFAPENYPK